MSRAFKFTVANFAIVARIESAECLISSRAERKHCSSVGLRSSWLGKAALTLLRRSGYTSAASAEVYGCLTNEWISASDQFAMRGTRMISAADDAQLFDPKLWATALEDSQG